MKREEAIAFLGYIMGLVGGGYHPDTKIKDYVYTLHGHQEKTFYKEEANRLQALHNAMLKVLGDEVYAIALNSLQYVSHGR